MIDYAYLRVSTKEQDEELQRRDVAPLAPEGAVWVTERVSAFKDNLRKREFRQVYDDVLAGKVRSLSVWDLDRIFRNRRKLVDFFQLCKAKGTVIRSARQSFLSDIEKAPAPWNEMLFHQMVQIFGYIAEEESRKKGDRVRQAVVRGDGRTLSYKGNRWGRKPLPKQTVAKVLELHAAGRSLRQIAAEVQVWDRHGNGRPISKSVVHKIIASSASVEMP